MSDKDTPSQPDPTVEETLVSLLNDLNAHLQSIDGRLENLESWAEELAQQTQAIANAIEYMDSYDDEDPE